MKHTPGPWKQHPYEKKAIVGDRGDKVTHDIAHICQTGKQATIEANARLIAAAPEMLAALKRIMVIFEREGIGSDEEESEPLYNDIKTIINRIEGRE